MKRRRPKKVEKGQEVGPPAVPAPPADLNRWWVHSSIILGLLLANLALYSRSFHLGFLSVDDPDYVQNNEYIEKLDGAKLKHILTVPYSANYAPANLLSYALDVALAGGKKAPAIHFSNVLWHGWVVCMVYLLAFTIADRQRRKGQTGTTTHSGALAEETTIGMAGSLRVALAAAAAVLFLLHPAHVEVVAWISSRKDLVATGFAVLAMTSYLRYRRQSKGWGWWYAGALLSFLLASAAKQSVLLLPAVMLVWDVLVERRRNWQMVADKLPFGLITLLFGWMTWHAQPSTNQAMHPFVFAATELENLWLLTGLGQYTLYRSAPDSTAGAPGIRLAIIVAAIVVWAVPLLWQKAEQPIRATLCYWVLIQMVPPMLLNFIVPITDRYLFLPSVGVCILLADLAAGLMSCSQRARWAAWAGLAGLGVVWGITTWNYTGEWRDPRSVWYGAHLRTKNPQVFQFLGEVYQNAGDHVNSFVKTGGGLEATNEMPLAQAVLGETDRVERLRAEWVGAAGPARTNSIAYRDRLWSLAWQQFEESLARRGTLSTPNLFMARGRLLVSQGKPQQAIPEFQKALAFAQNSSYHVVRAEGATHALFAIGVAYWNLGNYREAEKWLLQAQAVQKKSGQTWLPALDHEVERIKALAAGQK